MNDNGITTISAASIAELVESAAVLSEDHGELVAEAGGRRRRHTAGRQRLGVVTTGLQPRRAASSRYRRAAAEVLDQPAIGRALPEPGLG